MLINQKQIKQFVKDQGKQATKEFLTALDIKVLGICQAAIKKSNHHTRLTPAELIGG